MKFWETLKGVFKRMFSTSDIAQALNIDPPISSVMKDAINKWEALYTDNSPWVDNVDVFSMGIPATIASEKSRTATIEMEIKVTGKSPKAEFMRSCAEKIRSTIRENLEYGIALGSLIIKPYVVKNADGKYDIKISYVSALNAYPFSFTSDKKIQEIAFLEQAIKMEDKQEIVYTKVEYHKLEGTTLYVSTTAYKGMNRNTGIYSKAELGRQVPLTDVPEWADIEPSVVIENMDRMLFAYFKMPIANNIDLNSPFGISGFSRGVSLIQQADEQYSNLLWEFKGGQLAIDVDYTAINPTKDKNGKIINPLPQFQERLFRRNLDLGEDNVYNVFSPELRDASITSGLNTILMRIEDAVEISRGTLSIVEYADARTATELKILKQRSFSANQDVQTALQITLEDFFEVVDKYCDLYGMVEDGEYEIAYKWDDSIIVDKEAERQMDLLDIQAGLMSRIEYRMKWYGDTRESAEEAIKEINDDKQTYMQIQQDVVASNSAPARDNARLNRANESIETTKVGKSGQEAT